MDVSFDAGNFSDLIEQHARVRAIRAVVAAQWNTAINLMWAFSHGYTCRLCGSSGIDINPNRHTISCPLFILAMAPTAVEIVDGVA
jgi:hypothetical protein